ncbi:MAG: rod shape-determining protein MreC [Holosporales bacterium]|nr:rod shape-determining protein MreC [Holosporales bacterium]
MFTNKIKWKLWLRWGAILALACLLALADHFSAFSHIKRWTTHATVIGAKSVSRLGGAISSIFDNFSGKAAQETKRLKRELIACKIELEELKYFKDENTRLKAVLDFSSDINNKPVVFANIIRVCEFLTSNNIYIDKGRENGLGEEDVVVGESGVVGMIESVGSQWSKVKKVTNMDFYVSVCFSPSGISAILKGNGNGRLRIYLKENDNATKIPPGQTAVTNGYDKVFPSGILVGQVTDNEQITPSCGNNPMGIVCVISHRITDIKK